MGEISKPLTRTFWKITSTDGTTVVHEGYTDINQVTVTGQPVIEQSADADDIYPPLPAAQGTPIPLGSIWSYEHGMVVCIQAHNRTIFPPQDTPALFNTYRANTGNLDWLPNEAVELGDERFYSGDTYRALQSHTTQAGWEPDVTPALWQMIQTGEIPVWVQPTGAHDVYNTGDQVHWPTVLDAVYESTIDNNSWAPDVTGWIAI